MRGWSALTRGTAEGSSWRSNTRPCCELYSISPLGQKAISGHLNRVIRDLIAEGSISHTIPAKPRSRLQRHRLTDKGRGGVRH